MEGQMETINQNRWRDTFKQQGDVFWDDKSEKKVERTKREKEKDLGFILIEPYPLD